MVGSQQLESPPKRGQFFTDGKRLVEVLQMNGTTVVVEDARSLHVSDIELGVLAQKWRVVVPAGEGRRDG